MNKRKQTKDSDLLNIKDTKMIEKLSTESRLRVTCILCVVHIEGIFLNLFFIYYYLVIFQVWMVENISFWFEGGQVWYGRS